MLEVMTPYRRHGKLFFRCTSNGVAIYLTVWQITIRDGHEKATSDKPFHLSPPLAFLQPTPEH